MNHKCETSTFLQPSTSNHNHKGSKTSYTIQFLLSLSNVDTRLKLPMESHLSFSCAFQDESGFLSAPSFCAPDCRCYKIVPQNSHVKVPDDANHILHRSDKPYLPPRQNKALPPSSRDINNVLNCAISGFSECTNQEKTEQEIWSKVLDDGMHLMESEGYSNFDVEHPEGTSDVVESLNNSIPSSFLSHENCGNTKNSHCEVSFEKDIMELQLSELSTISACDGYPRRSTIDGDISEAYGLFPIEDGKHLQGVKHTTSINKKQNPSSPGFEIQQDFELNCSSSGLDGQPYSNSELCLPDGDSLIAFDEPFLKADEPFDKALSSPARNRIEPGAFSPSSPDNMIVKLIESILKDDSPPPHSLYAQQCQTQSCSNQFNPGGHHSFRLNKIDQAGFSFFSYHSFPTNTMSQPFRMVSCSSKLYSTLDSTSGYQQSSYEDFNNGT